MQFSINKMKQFVHEQSDKRVTRDSAEELDRILNESGSEISKIAIEVAEENDRKTVRGSDIKEAVRRLDR